MSKLLHLYCTLWLSAGLTFSAFSQEYHFQNFTELTGLPSSETYDVFQDRTGFIWIASDNGVVRYDGEEFVNFNSAQGLTDNTVFSFYEDKAGRIWFRTFSGQLSYYNTDTKEISVFKYNNTLQTSLQSSILNDLKVDALDNVWFATNMMGPSGVIDSNGKLTQYESNKDSSYVFLRSIKASQGEYSIGLAGAPILLKGIAIDNQYFPCAINRDFMSSPVATYVHWKGALLIAVNKDIFRYRDGKLGKVYSFSLPIISMATDSSGRLWAGLFTGGVYSFIDEAMTDPKPIRALVNSSISSILNDREGGLWFSTLDRGVFYFPNLSVRVRTYRTNVESKISKIATGKECIYVGRFNGEVTMICSSFDQPVWLHREEAPVSCLFEDDDGGLWGGSASGYFYTDKSRSYKLTAPGLSPRGFFTNRNKEVAVFNSSGFFNLSHKGEISGRYFLLRRPTQVLVSNGVTYVGSLNGLERFNQKMEYIDRDTFLIRSRIAALHAFDNRVWVGTIGSGLLFVDGDRVVNERDRSFPDVQNVYAILHVRKQLWIATDAGVFRGERSGADREKMEWKHLTSSSGLLSEKCTDLAYLNGEVLVFSERGVSFVPTDAAHFSNQYPQLYVKQLKVNSIETDPRELTLSANQNNISLDIGTISFNNREVVYRHRLKETNEWNRSKENNISYFSLLPGDYKLEVQASLNGFDWVAYAEPFVFTISPPWWGTWTFRVVLLVLLAAVVLMVYRLRISSIRRKHNYLELINTHQQRLIDSEIQTQERERKRIAKDLHDGVGTSLSSIKLLVSDAFRANSLEQPRKAQEINDTLTEVIADIKQIVYDLHPPALERYGLQVGLKNLTEKINNHGGVSILFDYYGQREVSPSTSISIYRIIQELINNTLKHAKASEIRIHINQFEDEMNIMYEDNGVGMVGSRFTGLGLHNIESRVRSLHGRMSWESNHKGTFYNFDIPY